MTPDLSSIAARIVGTCLGVDDGDAVLIRSGLYARPLAEALGIACTGRGAHPMLSMSSDEYRVESITASQDAALERTPPHLLAAVKASDVIINVGHYELLLRDPSLLEGIAEVRLSALRRAGIPIRDALFAGGKRSALVGYPSPHQAKVFGMAQEAYEDHFWAALDLDYDALGRSCRVLHDALDGTSEVHITNPDGTDIRVNITGRPLLMDDGVIDDEDRERGLTMLNLPAGEVCVAPVLKGTEGTAVFSRVLYKGAEVRDLALTFADGVLVEWHASAGEDLFRGMLEGATGHRDRLGELGIGTNPALTRAIGSLHLDEKVRGTIHLALGENRMMGGENESSLHWDLIMEHPTLEADGRTLIREGVHRTPSI